MKTPNTAIPNDAGGRKPDAGREWSHGAMVRCEGGGWNAQRLVRAARTLIQEVAHGPRQSRFSRFVRARAARGRVTGRAAAGRAGDSPPGDVDCEEERGQHRRGAQHNGDQNGGLAHLPWVAHRLNQEPRGANGGLGAAGADCVRERPLGATPASPAHRNRQECECLVDHWVAIAMRWGSCEQMRTRALSAFGPPALPLLPRASRSSEYPCRGSECQND